MEKKQKNKELEHYDKKRGVYVKTWTLNAFMILLISIFLLPTITALEYNNETIKTDLTSFEWKFNPNIQKDFYKENFEPYIDNLGCEDVKIKLYAVLPIKDTITNYYNENSCEWKENKTAQKINNSYPLYKECTVINKSKTQTIDYEEWFDLSKTDVFMTKDMYWVIKGTKKASTNPQSCDMNLNIDMNNDGDFIDPEDARVVEDGKAWWNITFNKKYLFNLSSANNTNFTFVKLFLNNSDITFSDCQSNGGDVRIINLYENDTHPYNITSWNNTNAELNINTTDIINESFYLYCNATSIQTTTSQRFLNLELVNDLISYYNYEESSGDLLDQLGYQDGNVTGTLARGETGSYGLAYHLNGASGRIQLDNANPITGNDLTFSTWFNADTAHVGAILRKRDTEFHIRTEADNSVLYQEDANFGYAVGYETSSWYHIAVKINSTQMYAYLNGTNVDSNAGAGVENNSNALYLGSNTADQYFDGLLDETAFHNRSLTDDEISLIYYLQETYPWYGVVTPNISAGVDYNQITTLTVGLYDEDYNNHSLVVDEGEEFFVWAAFNYTNNNTAVYPNGFCNWSAKMINQEDYFKNEGVNVTVCNTGCDYTNRTYEVTNLETEGYINDFVRLKLCRDDSLTTKTYTVHTSCGYLQTFSYGSVPLCANGYGDLFLNTTACGGAVTSANVSLWTSGSPNANELRMVDSLIGLDRLHNHSQLLLWNDSFKTFVGLEREYYGAGFKEQNINCYANVSGINNVSSTFNITVSNVPPVVFIDQIWDFLTGTVLFNGVVPSMRRPLSSAGTINITGGAVDDNLDSCSFNLSFENETVINNFTLFLSGAPLSGSVNYTQSNFSVEDDYLDGTKKYLWNVTCNDTDGNFTLSDVSFTAENARPVVSWTNTTPLLVGTMPVIINWTVTDYEGETPFCYLLQNGTLNTSGSGLLGHTVNLSNGDYNFTVLCSDSLRNSTAATLILSYTEGCLIDVIGLYDGGRYDVLDHNLQINCSNSVTPESCYFSINDYANETVANCSDFNISLHRGKNDLVFSTLNGGVMQTELVGVHAFNKNATLWDFPYLFILIALLVVFIIAASYYRIPILGVGIVVIGCLVGIELAMFSLWASVSVILLGFVAGLAAIFWK